LSYNNATMLHTILVTAQNFNEAVLVHKQICTISAIFGKPIESSSI